MKEMSVKAALLSVGSELLSGRTVNLHPSYLGANLLELGITLHREVTVPDDVEEIKEALKDLINDYQVVLVTGGLGPTEDDVTREAVAEALGRRLKKSNEVESLVRRRVKELGGEMRKIHERYTIIPDGFEPIYNDKGIAPGLFGREGNTLIVVLPGPPRELKAVFERVKERLSPLSRENIVFKTIKTFGKRESEIAEILEPYKEQLWPIGFYPSLYGVDIRLEARGEDRVSLIENLKKRAQKIRELLGLDVYGEDDDTMESVFGKIMRQKRLTVATAESCTGGLVANLITDVSGSSNYMIGSVVAYHNRIKEEVLGVPKAILMHFGAVSEPTALLMAEGVRKLYEVDIGLSTTGIAGPTGGTPQKPVGLVYMGVSFRGKTRVIKRIFKGNRLEIKRQTALTVLDLARRVLLQE